MAAHNTKHDGRLMENRERGFNIDGTRDKRFKQSQE